MTSDFVGRDDEIARLLDILAGRTKGKGKLTVLGIAGAGGCGKSMLLEHAKELADLDGRNYLTLAISGLTEQGGLTEQVERLVDSATIGNKPIGFYFPSVKRVLGKMKAIRQEAGDQATTSSSTGVTPDQIGRWVDDAFAIGAAINDCVPITKTFLDASAVAKHADTVKKAVPYLQALQQEAPGLLDRVGLGTDKALRNSVRQNAAGQLASALVSDLSAILCGYQTSDRFKPTHKKLPDLDRLLLIIDDFEITQASMGVFLARELLPLLKQAHFESVVIILGRDSLGSAEVAFDNAEFHAHQLPQMFLGALKRQDMDELLGTAGIHDPVMKARAWEDTQGYPYYLSLWIEEAQSSGGGSAEMLRRFHRRTTRWMSDTQVEWLRTTLFMDDVNPATLRVMLNPGADAKLVAEWFEKEASVRDHSTPQFRVRPYVRHRLLGYLRVSNPDRYKQLAERAKARLEKTAGGSPRINPLGTTTT